MIGSFWRHVRQNVVGYVALFVVLGGTAVAADHIAKVRSNAPPAVLGLTNDSATETAISPGGAVPFNSLDVSSGDKVVQSSPTTVVLRKRGTYHLTVKAETSDSSPPGTLTAEVNDLASHIVGQVVTSGAPIVLDGFVSVTDTPTTIRIVNSGTETLVLAPGRSASLTVEAAS